MRDVIEFSTWFTRGWTFQELVFSNRILYFTPERTYYCCAVGNWSEDYPFDDRIPLKVYADYLRDDDPKLGFDFANQLDPFENYSTMVDKMSLRDFTREDDILDACKGFYTDMIQNEMGTSMCGLPANCFEFALAWQPNGNIRPRGNSSTPSLNKFPSWSWAGWVGPVTYPFLPGPQKLEIKRSISWNLGALFSSSKELLHRVHPVRLTRSPTWNCTQWSSLPADLDEERHWQTESRTFRLPKNDSDEPTRQPFIESGLLIFRTMSIFCPISEILAPDSAERKGLKFFSILHNSTIIGELKIDSATLERSFALNQLDNTVSVELISLFEMDFGSEAMKRLFWMDSLSRRKTFGTDFSEMIEGRKDKMIRVVLWIRWDGDVAYRIALGYVTVEGFEAAGPAEKEIALG
jgi:hypothetical protein